MPSALETLVKILKLEQDTDFQDRAVIGGLKSFAGHWATEAHAQAKKPEHHALVDELVGLLEAYAEPADKRPEAIRYMLGRITGRIPPPAGIAPRAIELPVTQPQESTPEPDAPTQPPRRDEPRPEREHQPRERQTQTHETQHQRSQSQPREERQDDRRNRDQGHERQQRRQGQKQEQQPVSRAVPQTVQEGADPFSSDEQFLAPGEAVSEPEFGEGTKEEAPRQSREYTRRRRTPNPERDLNVLQGIHKSVSIINGIGPKMAEKLEQLGIYTIEDLLYFFPRRYDDYTRMPPLNRIQPEQMVTAIGTVRNNVVFKGKRGIDILNVTIDDGAGVLVANFFGQPYLRSRLERGVQVVFSGKTELFRGKITMNNPEWELLEREALHTRAIVPIYPLTKGLSAHNMRRFTRIALEQWSNDLPDYLPESVLERIGLPELSWAVQQMHYPNSMESLEEARRRLSFNELILLQLGVIRNRRDWQSVAAESIQVSDEWLNSTASSLPYPLTGAQVRAVQAVREDIAREVPMNRLLQGDVGAGKTAVAALAMAIAAVSGFQSAIMAPTSILAEQHFRGISKLIHNLPGCEWLNIRLLTGATSAQDKNEILWGLGEGSIHIVIGTHALLESNVNFNRLGLAVIDEQHRFGVEQRGKLRGKGTNPHLLVMTATPIPRTLALTMYADLDLTVLDEMPPGRTPIETRVLFGRERERAYSFIDSQLDKGRQAFIVYPLVEASESETMSNIPSAVEEHERLQKDIFPHRKLGLLHGRMSPSEKEDMMAAFGRGDFEILVSTSVVEVGIDVPNASVILIEGANRFGLAQLHQFRGRVGRGEHQSYCLLIADDGTDTNERLRAMEETTDGFKLAEFDWKLRGAGDLLGTRQSGGAAQLGEAMNPRLVEDAQLEARTIYEEDPYLEQPHHTVLREVLYRRYGNSSADVS